MSIQTTSPGCNRPGQHQGTTVFGSLNWWREAVDEWCRQNRVLRSTSQIRKIARRLYNVGVVGDVAMQIAREVDRQIVNLDNSVGLHNMVESRRGSRIADGEIERKAGGWQR
ncbi:hypothetical protein FEZ32_00535 [Acidipropionibacterium jensenii]|uniref:hypothetical protein n=1 Tax=Acidipropionibacterium jensenii TaxID=1749 RepID=UPI00110B02B8|nr:hypothetical protein [Acidipropionibacterium jensenii]QCV87053.1 hypothetical protein FEZ32_00535 [Acidipropionibacterium jensenii]